MGVLDVPPLTRGLGDTRYALRAPGLAPAARIPTRRSVTMLADLGTAGHGFTASSGVGTSNLNDTTAFARGTQSATVTTKGDGSSTAGIRKTGLTPIDMSSKKLEVSVRVSDWTKCRSITVYVGRATFGSFYVWNLYDRNQRSTSLNKPSGDGEWVVFTVDHASLASTTGTPDLTAVTDIQVSFVDDGTGAITCGVNHLALFPNSPAYPNGVVSLSFDDTYQTHYTVVRPKLDQYAFGGTFYTIVESVLNGSVTLAQLRAMQDVGGHEIAAHAFTYLNHNATGGFASLSETVLHEELAQLKMWLRANGFNGADHLAFPQGITSPLVEKVARQYFASARTTFRHPVAAPRPAHPLRITSSGFAYPNQTLSQGQGEVDAAFANAAWRVLHFHDIVASPPSPPGTPVAQWDTASFNSLIDYIAAKGIPVRTVGEVLADQAPVDVQPYAGAIAAPLTAPGSYYVINSPTTAGTSNALGIGTLRLQPWLVHRATPLSRLGADIATVGDAGGKFRIVIYSDNGANYPGALLLDAGQVSADATGLVDATVSTVLQPGLYWVGGAVQQVTTTQPTIRTISSFQPSTPMPLGSSPAANATLLAYAATGITDAPPATFPTSIITSGLAARIHARR